jgi:hypothetical protein
MLEFVSKFSAVINKTAGWKGMRVWLLASPSIFIIKRYLFIVILSAVTSQTQIPNRRRCSSSDELLRDGSTYYTRTGHEIRNGSMTNMTVQ